MKAITPELNDLANGTQARIPPEVSLQWVAAANGKSAIEVRPTKAVFSEKDTWVVVLDSIAFTDGVIEFDALGQSGPQQSNFLGIAFRVVDQTTYDAVYFRPFNFRADDAARRLNAVQYISHPHYPWYALRKDTPGQYEKPIVPPPDGDGWFHARIVIHDSSIAVYVNDAREPSLAVTALGDQTGGGVGLWVGPGRGGCIANLSITPAA